MQCFGRILLLQLCVCNDLAEFCYYSNAFAAIWPNFVTTVMRLQRFSRILLLHFNATTVIFVAVKQRFGIILLLQFNATTVKFAAAMQELGRILLLQ